MEIDVKAYIKLILRYWWLIACLMAAGVAVTYWVQTNLTEPVYQATVKLLMNHTPQVVESGEVSSVPGAVPPDYDTIRTNLMLMRTYVEVLTSSTVLDEAAARVSDTMTGSYLANMLYVDWSSDSQVLTLYIQDSDYARAAALLAAVTDVFREKLAVLLGIERITLLHEADPSNPPAPVNGSVVVYMLIAAIASCLFGIAIVTAVEYMNDTFRRVGELERELDMPVLAVVPAIRRRDCEWHHSYSGRVGEGNHVVVKQRT
jgi:capsular polysaccharide biosynthesis protein